MPMFQKIGRFFFTLYAFATFILIMFLLLPFIVLASFFGIYRGGNAIYKLCTLWADINLFLWGIRHRNVYEAPPAKGHAVVYVCNHISFIDIPFMLKAFRHQHFRVLGKSEMARIPVFGFIYRKSAVMVNRESESDRKKSVAALKEFLAKEISVVIAPEGTFNETNRALKDFYNGAFRIAVETNTPVQPVLLLDGFNRMPYTSLFSLNPGKSRAIFLPETDPGTDALTLKEKVYHIMEDGLIRYKASWIKSN
jgi:1-acyl-sn-glycerol-3-phosphate acyltransferase